MKFPLGRVVITATAKAELDDEDVRQALVRHIRGDWGDTDAHDTEANERALKDGSRLFSVYHSRASVRFYIITEWDRSYTTILLPSDY